MVYRVGVASRLFETGNFWRAAGSADKGSAHALVQPILGASQENDELESDGVRYLRLMLESR